MARGFCHFSQSCAGKSLGCQTSRTGRSKKSFIPHKKLDCEVTPTCDTVVMFWQRQREEKVTWAATEILFIAATCCRFLLTFKCKSASGCLPAHPALTSARSLIASMFAEVCLYVITPPLSVVLPCPASSTFSICWSKGGFGREAKVSFMTVSLRGIQKGSTWFRRHRTLLTEKRSAYFKLELVRS